MNSLASFNFIHVLNLLMSKKYDTKHVFRGIVLIKIKLKHLLQVMNEKRSHLQESIPLKESIPAWNGFQ